jgi:8-oxo-dGTP pyrophosphatase MutT (NUDIX family)
LLEYIKKELGSKVDEVSDCKNYASVSIILSEIKNSINILFIERAERAGDPWSGDIAFPGGKGEFTDASKLITAIRETKEEIGLDLYEKDCIGKLSNLSLESSHNFSIFPYVFQKIKYGEFKLDIEEVADCFWVDLNNFLNISNYYSTIEVFKGDKYTVPYIMLNNKKVWGITYILLAELLIILVNSNKLELKIENKDQLIKLWENSKWKLNE